MLDIQTERVLVVPTEVFHRLGHFQGFTDDVERYFDPLFDPANLSYRPRNEVEEDPSFKQLIPYIVFRYSDRDRSDTLFAYTRGKGQGESRLHSKRSIGIGGHISATDALREFHPYEEGLRCELAEEVTVETPYKQQCVGLINDDETEVGRVHLGVVHIFDVAAPRVRPREKEITAAGFEPIDQLLADRAAFESWSQICLEALFE